jgi:hypothetical protein
LRCQPFFLTLAATLLAGRSGAIFISHLLIYPF